MPKKALKERSCAYATVQFPGLSEYRQGSRIFCSVINTSSFLYPQPGDCQRCDRRWPGFTGPSKPARLVSCIITGEIYRSQTTPMFILDCMDLLPSCYHAGHKSKPNDRGLIYSC
jgi:hypothetical protein